MFLTRERLIIVGMSVETLVKEYNKLSERDKARFMALLSVTTEDNIPDWAHEATEALSEEEWVAIEQLRDDVRTGKAQTKSFQDVMADLRK